MSCSHHAIGPNVTLNVQIVQGLALSIEIARNGADKALVPVVTDVGRGSQSVVVNGDGGQKQFVDNASMGNNSGRGVAGCTSIGVNRLRLNYVF